MKKNLLLLFFLIAFNKTKAQVVFCPPGAEWHYNFGDPFGPQLTNETIKYYKDSIIGLDTLKVLSHLKFYISCNPLDPVSQFLTLIKQKGDTIFFKNSRTQNSWQILYNFAVQSGQGWQTTVLKYNNTPITYSFIVDSIKYVNVNTINLKRMYLNSDLDPGYITERLGWNSFLFRYYNSSCDGDFIKWMLCYKDNSFGQKQFTTLPCDFSNPLEINENNQNDFIKLYPNPVNDFLNIETTATEKIEISFTDVFGREVKKVTLEGNSKIDVSDLNKGIYFISILNTTGLLYTTKLIKE